MLPQYVFTLFKVEVSATVITPIPFLLVTLLVLGYYIRKRYRLYQEIKRVPPGLLFMENYKNHLKNLKVKSMVSTVIIVILIVEFLYNVTYILSKFPIWLSQFGVNDQHLEVFQGYVSSVNVVLRLSFVPLLNFFMDLLWLVYRKYEYKYTRIKWITYIVVRVILMVYVNTSFLPTSIDTSLIQLNITFFHILDFIQFIYYSRRFYRHLKSREKEIRLFYFDRKAYLDSRYLRIHFMVATILVIIALFFFTLTFAIQNVYFVLGNILLFAQADFTTFLDLFFLPYMYTLVISLILTNVVFTLNYVYIVLVVVLKSIRDRQKLANINEAIKPIMKKYHDNFFNNRSNF